MLVCHIILKSMLWCVRVLLKFITAQLSFQMVYLTLPIFHVVLITVCTTENEVSIPSLSNILRISPIAARFDISLGSSFSSGTAVEVAYYQNSANNSFDEVLVITCINYSVISQCLSSE